MIRLVHVAIILALLNTACIGVLATFTCTSVVVSGTEELLYSGTYNFDGSLDGYLDSSKSYILGSLEASIPQWRLAPYSMASSAVAYNYPYYFVYDTASHPASVKGDWWLAVSQYESRPANLDIAIACIDSTTTPAPMAELTPGSVTAAPTFHLSTALTPTAEYTPRPAIAAPTAHEGYVSARRTPKSDDDSESDNTPSSGGRNDDAGEGKKRTRSQVDMTGTISGAVVGGMFFTICACYMCFKCNQEQT